MQQHVLLPAFAYDRKDFGGSCTHKTHKTHDLPARCLRAAQAVFASTGWRSLLYAIFLAALIAPADAHAAVVVVTITGFATLTDTTGVFGFPPNTQDYGNYKLVFTIDDSEGTEQIGYNGAVAVKSFYNSTKKNFHSTASLEINGVTWQFQALPSASKGSVQASTGPYTYYNIGGTQYNTFNSSYAVESDVTRGTTESIVQAVIPANSGAWAGTWNWNWETAFYSAVTSPPYLNGQFIISLPGSQASGTLTPQTLTVGGPMAPNPAAITLAQPVQVPTGVSPGTGVILEQIVAADFDSNGNQDLAVVDNKNASVSVLLGNGKGKFHTPVLYPTGNAPFGIVARDFNGDGLVDLAVTNSSDNTVIILLNLGKGVFPAQPSFTYAVGITPGAVASADLNNDGFLDLVVINATSNTASVLLGKGDGSFQAAVSYSTGGTEAISAAVMDLNNDGHPDLVVANEGSSSIVVLLNDGTGKFLPQKTYTISTPRSVAIGDFNGDGYPDVVTADYDAKGLTVLLNDRTGNLLPGVNYAVGTVPTSVLAQDLNGDGTLDFAVTNLDDGTISLLLGKGDGTFVTQPAIAIGSQPATIAAADFNGDNKPDLAITSLYASSVGVLLQTTP